MTALSGHMQNIVHEITSIEYGSEQDQIFPFDLWQKSCYWNGFHAWKLQVTIHHLPAYINVYLVLRHKYVSLGQENLKIYVSALPWSRNLSGVFKPSNSVFKCLGDWLLLCLDYSLAGIRGWALLNGIYYWWKWWNVWIFFFTSSTRICIPKTARCSTVYRGPIKIRKCMFMWWCHRTRVKINLKVDPTVQDWQVSRRTDNFFRIFVWFHV